MFSKPHKVHLSDTDVTGQVYYVRPLEWMEWCRVDWFEENFGNFMKYVQETGITFFPSKVITDYKRPMLFGDALTIELRAREIKKISFIFEYTIKRDDTIVLTSDITMVCFNTKKQRLSPLPEDILQKLSTLTVTE